MRGKIPQEGADEDWRVEIVVDETFKEAREALIRVLTPLEHEWEERRGYVKDMSHRIK